MSHLKKWTVITVTNISKYTKKRGTGDMAEEQKCFKKYFWRKKCGGTQSHSVMTPRRV